jgi:hypothetical protein
MTCRASSSILLEQRLKSRTEEGIKNLKISATVQWSEFFMKNSDLPERGLSEEIQPGHNMGN